MRVTPQLPELQDACDIPCGENPPHIVEVAHIQASIWATGQSHRGQQLVSVSKTVTAGAGDAPPAPIPYHAADHWGLLGDEDVLPIAHMKNTWWGHRKETSNTCNLLRSSRDWRLGSIFLKLYTRKKCKCRLGEQGKICNFSGGGIKQQAVKSASLIFIDSSRLLSKCIQASFSQENLLWEALLYSSPIMTIQHQNYVTNGGWCLIYVAFTF